MTTSLSKSGLSLKEPQERRQKRLAILVIALFVALSLLFFFFVGRPMLRFFHDPESFRLWADSKGLWGRVAFVGMMALQIVIAIIPGEPLEIGAGYAFGIWEGTLLCMIGVVVGSAVVFLLVKRWGMPLVELFFPREKILNLKFLQDSKRLHLIIFILFFIPGTPKDIMTYFVGLTPMRLSTWLLITSIARIPSIITSTIGGDALGLQNYQFAVIVFGITLLISLAGILVYRKVCRNSPR